MMQRRCNSKLRHCWRQLVPWTTAKVLPKEVVNWQLLTWPHLFYWPRWYHALWLGVAAWLAMLVSYLSYVQPVYQHYQQIRQRNATQWQHVQQGHQLIEQIPEVAQLEQRWQQAFNPPAQITESSFPTILAHITQLSEQHGVQLIKLLPQQHAGFAIQLQVQTTFWPCVRFIHALMQLPYAVQLAQIALTLDTANADQASGTSQLIGQLILKSYAYA